jgi:hypothetical protein
MTRGGSTSTTAHWTSRCPRTNPDPGGRRAPWRWLSLRSSYYHDHFKFLGMPFGPSNALATFQELMNDILRPFLRRFVLAFLDHILIYSLSWSKHLQHIHLVLDTLHAHSLQLKRSKCSLAYERELIQLVAYEPELSAVSNWWHTNGSSSAWSKPSDNGGCTYGGVASSSSPTTTDWSSCWTNTCLRSRGINGSTSSSASTSRLSIVPAVWTRWRMPSLASTRTAPRCSPSPGPRSPSSMTLLWKGGLPRRPARGRAVCGGGERCHVVQDIHLQSKDGKCSKSGKWLDWR